MKDFIVPVQIRWADIDANRHLRHSVYYDYGASVRMKILSDLGLTIQKLEAFAIGPVLLREEAIFKREIKFEDEISISATLLKSTANYGRWSLQHHLTKSDGTLAAILNVDGAWIDIVKRKMAEPNEFIRNIFDQLPKSPDYALTPDR